ncbi:branched-chain amino acid aminotransferase [Desulfotomaculum nigrificans CO-1-SRB]|uniref:Branched-chain-amino-acid aminotransferase n=1 Tax=Desulfotomaculum nigrificans (strain DSM 14880 / VKM B-2319 / CO-1-SRB) TaxID=868595 RepID=F6B6K6_DESCC|nr:branched-chain amino acid aminotransferase [Desulfotomaculum nigrificans]AEF94380.1 branched-chain amino acid aminotransferase [Desulfotomaculum nigrificans CO-1-SRB]
MKILVENLSEEELKPLYEDPNQLGFGRIFTDRMFTMRYKKGMGWTDARIEKYKNFSFDPSSCVYHYSQEIFEGLKAYAGAEGQILLFRPEQNVKRMNRSAERLVMPTIPEEDMLQAIEELVVAEKRWIPKAPGTSMYIRPTMVATEPFLGVHPSSEYLFYIILSPVGAYYKEGFQPVKLYVEDTYVRAVVGGVGDIKTGGNYAASLLAGYKAQQMGFSQVLWLDACQHKYIEEVGSMNMFFVFGNKLVTPALTGSILPGITRASILQLAQHLGYETEERPISIDEVIEGINQGTLTEAFGSGTAAVISPVGSLYFKEKDYVINNNQVGPVTEKLYNTLVDIQYGRTVDPFGWVREIGKL